MGIGPRARGVKRWAVGLGRGLWALDRGPVRLGRGPLAVDRLPLAVGLGSWAVGLRTWALGRGMQLKRRMWAATRGRRQSVAEDNKSNKERLWLRWEGEIRARFFTY